MGRCSHGSKCFKDHSRKPPPCAYFKAGNCSKGMSCDFSHARAASIALQRSSDSDPGNDDDSSGDTSADEPADQLNRNLPLSRQPRSRDNPRMKKAKQQALVTLNWKEHYGDRPATEPVAPVGAVSAAAQAEWADELQDVLPAPAGSLAGFTCQVFWDCENVQMYLRAGKSKDHKVTPQSNFEVLRHIFVDKLGVDKDLFKIYPVLSRHSAKSARMKLTPATINSFQR